MGERLAWRRAYIWAMLAFLLGMPLFVKSPYHLHVLIMAGLNTVLAASLALIVRTGQISFAHPAFMAIGAYTSTLLVTEVGLSYWLALVMACLAAGFVALLVGYPILRVK
jgi:branched-chain amino acid transport system permease protein